MEEEKKKKGLIDIKSLKKEKLNDILVFFTLAFVVIVTSSACAVAISSASRRKHKQNLNASEVIENVEVGEEKKKIPKLSEEAKVRLENIYLPVGEEKVAYLTFDDGPSSSITPQILEILRNENIKATFFVLGSRVELYPELLKQEYEEGHYIANHGYSHVYTSIYSSPNAVLDEYNNTEARIKSVIGEEYSSYLFRFPGGSEGGKYSKVKNSAKTLLNQNNIAYINWNCLTNDSVGKPTYQSLVSELKKTSNGKQNIVILMHDTGAKQLTVDSLTEIIHYLKEQGYVFKNFYDIMY